MGLGYVNLLKTLGWILLLLPKHIILRLMVISKVFIYAVEIL